MAKIFWYLVTVLVLIGVVALPHVNVNERSRAIAARLRMVRKQKLRKTFRQIRVGSRQINIVPKGYTFDPCSYHRDCIAPRLCVRPNFSSSCSGVPNCLCIGRKTQLCNNCEECANFPDETCANDPGENADLPGICASSYTILEGILVEKGCNNFPGISPLPDFPQPQESPDTMVSPTATPTPVDGPTGEDDGSGDRKESDDENDIATGEGPQASGDDNGEFPSPEAEADVHTGPCSSSEPSALDSEVSSSPEDIQPEGSVDVLPDDIMYGSQEPESSSEELLQPYDIPDCSFYPNPTSESVDATGPVVFT